MMMGRCAPYGVPNGPLSSGSCATHADNSKKRRGRAAIRGPRVSTLERVADIAGGYRLAAARDVISAVEWDLVASGVRQRVRALEAFLADVYGEGRAFDDGVLPWRLVFGSEKFRREVTGVVPPNGVRVHVAAVDLVRGEDGRFRVLGHNVGIPPGTSYPGEYPSRLLGALRAAAPHGVADPFVVLLTPGEHAPLAGLMGVELAEGRDLSCHQNRVYLRGRRQVDVIYRLVDDDWLDPLHFRPDSGLGCPGLLNAARSGTVTIANAVGNGIAGDTLVHPCLPALVGYYLGEEPLLGTAEPGRHDDGLRLFTVHDGSNVWVLPGEPRGG